MADGKSTGFDPYHQWLGIPPNQQPADHYRLLGVRSLEDDLDVIASAADRQMSHLKTFASGRYSEASQNLLNEIARARLCLLNPHKKKQYDQQLREKLKKDVATPQTTRSTVGISDFRGETGSIRVECPHCQSMNDASSELSGEIALCSNCKQKLRVPIPAARLVSNSPLVSSAPPDAVVQPSTAPDFSHPLVVDHRTVRPGKRKQKSVASALIRIFVCVALVLGVMYAGRIFVQQRLDLAKKATPAQTTKSPPATIARPSLREKKNGGQQERLEREVDVVVPLQHEHEFGKEPPRAVPPVVPLTPLPAHLTLPEMGNPSITTLVALSVPASISLVTNSTSLRLEANRISWTKDDASEPQVIAGLAIRDDALQFRWIGEVPEDAETALRNSLVQVDRSGHLSVIALRSPAVVETFNFELKKAVRRIACKSKHMPPAKTIKFDFVDAGRLPPFAEEGGSLHALELRQVATLRYSAAKNVKSTIELLKRGKIVVVEINSLFMLPSGDIEALSISAGTKEHKELSKLIASAESAQSQLSSIKQRLAELNQELIQWKRMPTTRRLDGALVPDIGAAIRKDAGIKNTENSILYGKARLAKANRLIADLPAMQRVLQSLQSILSVAEQLHKTTDLGFRFFFIVDGHEVNLVVADAKPE